tara:strand:+ start:3863 stop:4195 length:333 start_codon:yes stop_codon:yes gene_type:complete
LLSVGGKMTKEDNLERDTEGIKKLMIALVKQSISDLEKSYNQMSKHEIGTKEYINAKRSYDENDEWFNDLRSSYVFSFQSICDNLGIDSNAARETIYKGLEKKIDEGTPS